MEAKKGNLSQQRLISISTITSTMYYSSIVQTTKASAVRADPKVSSPNVEVVGTTPASVAPKLHTKVKGAGTASTSKAPNMLHLKVKAVNNATASASKDLHDILTDSQSTMKEKL
jgi:hypothetical protein